MDLSVILVRPLYQGNVGAIARAMANFDISKLIIVGSYSVEEEARCRAKHANHVLDNIVFYKSLNALRKDFDVLVATTGIVGSDYNLPRSPLTLREAVNECKSVNGKIGLVFGPEDNGLSADNLSVCDFSLSIPSSSKYPVLNLSHAASIVFYEFFKVQKESFRSEHKLASVREREELVSIINEIVDNMEFRAESDRDTQKVVWRRVIGKSFFTKRELFAVFGFFKNVKHYFNKKK